MATKRKNATPSAERTAKKSRQEADQENTKKAPTLLSIPPELRNRIYEEVLISDREIDISNTATKPPSLLSTCRQIRQETRQMWYFQNRFVIVICGCNSDLCVKFERSFANLKDDKGKDIKHKVVLNLKLRPGARDWPNLLEWCERVQSCLCRSADPARPEHLNYVCVITTAHDIARQHRSSKGWDDCRKVLESLRGAFGRLDARWLQE